MRLQMAVMDSDVTPMMIEEFEYTDLWWLPETPEKQICETIRFTHGEGAVLDLMDFIDAKTEVRIVSPEAIIGRYPAQMPFKVLQWISKIFSRWRGFYRCSFSEIGGYLRKQCLYSRYYSEFKGFRNAIIDFLNQTDTTYKEELDSLPNITVSEV